MEQLLTGIPNTLIGWITTLFLTGISITYISSKVRKNDMQILRDANADLRAFHEDNVKKLDSMQKEINTLCTKVEVLESKNKTLEDLVVVALKQYFFEHPNVADTVKGTIKE